MNASASYRGFSASVTMRLRLDGRMFRIEQMGPDFVILESPNEYPPSRAIIEIRVDEFHQIWEVLLPHGISAVDPRVKLGNAR